MREAARAGAAREVRLTAKGVDFGVLRATAEGTIAAAGIRGVDTDVVVRPFGWKGTAADFADFSSEALQVHMGIQSDRLLTTVRTAARRRRRSVDADRDGSGASRPRPGAAMIRTCRARDPLGRAAWSGPPARSRRDALPRRRPQLRDDFYPSASIPDLGCRCATCRARLESPSWTEGCHDRLRGDARPALTYDSTLGGYPVCRSATKRTNGAANLPQQVREGSRQDYLTSASGASRIRPRTCTTAVPRASTMRSRATTARAPSRGRHSRRCRTRRRARCAST